MGDLPQLTAVQKAAMATLREMALNFMSAIDAVVPVGPSADMAKVKVQEAAFWAVHGLTK
jgi:hypothetical protein